MPATTRLEAAPAPLQGQYAPAFATLARHFAHTVTSGEEIGAALCVYHHGECVVDLWGGWADRTRRTPWQADSLVVVFSVTKGLAAMALNLAAQQGAFDWDAPVAHYWRGFAQNGKDAITVRQLFNHRAGLASLHTPLGLAQCCDPGQRSAVRTVLEQQAPAWQPGSAQGYHALSFGLYASEFFSQAVGEPLADFLQREYLAPLGADVHLGTPASEDPRIATLYPVSDVVRVGCMVWAALRGGSAESAVARSFLSGQDAKGAFSNPAAPQGLGAYNQPPVRRAALAWASATASARGLARAYVPWSVGGTWQGRQWVRPHTIAPLHERQSWAAPDRVLGKPLGWSQGFLKEEATVFSPNPESFGHSGIGGTLGWCDPKAQLAIGYVMNRSDWRVRSPRALNLCRILYGCLA
jgi:CubicO group peptidase (beta-lactamase class C family)